jgi:hypothetical protein
LGGKTEIVEGADIADAFSNGGYGYGAVAVLDYYEEVTDSKTDGEKPDDK